MRGKKGDALYLICLANQYTLCTLVDATRSTERSVEHGKVEKHNSVTLTVQNTYSSVRIATE
jgi:hypothetical protein